MRMAVPHTGNARSASSLSSVPVRRAWVWLCFGEACRGYCRGPGSRHEGRLTHCMQSAARSLIRPRASRSPPLGPPSSVQYFWTRTDVCGSRSSPGVQQIPRHTRHVSPRMSCSNISRSELFRLVFAGKTRFSPKDRAHHGSVRPLPSGVKHRGSPPSRDLATPSTRRDSSCAGVITS